jgi:acyl-CoA synthetase (NDP forming)
MTTWEKAIFAPRRVALVGASSGSGKMGRVFMENLLEGYEGQIYPVHPKEKSIFGRTAYSNLQGLPEKPDLAVVITPPGAVCGVIEDCAKVGIEAAVIITSGFAETGSEGRAVQNRIGAIAKDAGLRLVGPNCFGVINVHEKFNASLGLALPQLGGISLFTQSGAYGMLSISRFEKRAAGFAKIFAPGNKSDLDEVDLVKFFGDDPDTKVIAMLLESVVDVAAFSDAAKKAARQKPVVILKTGRTKAARRAAENHTASKANDESLAEAVSGSGVHFVKDGRAFLEAAATFSRLLPQKGSRIAIITNSGGAGVELTDLLEERGFSVPLLSGNQQALLQEVIPNFGSTKNPVDMTPDAPRYPEMYASLLKILLDCNEIDVVVVVLVQRSALSSEVTNRIVSEVEKTGLKKPVHVCWDESPGSEDNRLKLENAGIPCHAWTLAAADAIKLCHYFEGGKTPC